MNIIVLMKWKWNKFLGYCIRRGAAGQVKLAIAAQSVHKARERLRQITQRTRGRSMERIARDLQGYVRGWKAYFQLTQSRTVLRELDQWLRRRLRAVQLKQWKTGPTAYRALVRLGAPAALAASVASRTRRWWHCSLRVQNVLDIAYFDRLDVPKFC